MPSTYRLTRRVAFSETDAAGIVHFANFFRYMESAEHAFFRSLGLSLHGDTAEGVRGWARVHAECDYRLPLRYEDVMTIELTVVGKGSCTLSYEFVFRLQGSDEIHAEGKMRVCCVGRAPGEARLRAMPMPPEVDAAVAPAS